MSLGLNRTFAKADPMLGRLRSMRLASRPLRAIICLAVAVGLSTASASRGATPDEVEKALQKAKAHLYDKMDASKFWEEVAAPEPGGSNFKSKQWGGLTALAVYALLSSGDKHLDPKLAPAIDWLKKQHLTGTYALGLRAQLWTFLPPTKENLQGALKDRDYLYRGLHRTPLVAGAGVAKAPAGKAPANPPKKAPATKAPKAGAKAATGKAAGNPAGGGASPTDRIGFYGSFVNDAPGAALQPGDPSWDLSLSRYGVLGMWACAQVDGVEVPLDYWMEVDKAWKNAQVRDGDEAGGWQYKKGGGKAPDNAPAKAAITAGGIATLFITQDYITDQTSQNDCQGGTANPNIDAALGWMDSHIRQLLTGHVYHGIFSVERIGAASGKKYFGDLDWYTLGADEILKDQQPNGAWGSVEATCYAMLFLSSGRSPVAINKLEYGLSNPAYKDIKEPWDQRPRDVANFAKFASRISEQSLNWQIVNLRAKPQDLQDAPVLFVSGSRALDFSEEEVGRLRDYCLTGGLVLFNADCGEEDFVKSVVGSSGIGRRMFNQFEWRELPITHPIYTEEVFPAKNWKSRPRLLALSNGVRELAIIAPDIDLGRAWQSRAEKTKREQYELGMNIFYYAAEHGSMGVRGQSNLIAVDPNAKPKASVRVARLLVGDNPDPEPYGWQRLAAAVLNQAGIRANLEKVPLGDKKLAAGAGGYPLAHLTGTGRFLLSQQQRDELKAYVNGGGTLVVDAAGGDPAFADCAERELAATFGGDPAAIGPILAPDEPLYTIPGFKIDRFDFRRYARGKTTGKLNIPHVRAIEIAGKPRVFYSREDLTAGLVGQRCDGIIGYAPQTALQIMRNLVIYASFNGKMPAAAGPASATGSTTSPGGAEPATKPAAPAKKGAKKKKAQPS